MLKLNKKTINQHDPQGKRHGVWQLYSEDGTLRWRENQIHGVLTGLCVYFYSHKKGLCNKEYYLNIK
jgi:antitoxin component YwqK of YwqJK toxin-antitoxin module